MIRARTTIAAALTLWTGAACAQLMESDFTDVGTFTVPVFVDGPLTVIGSADLRFLNFNGLGVVGGSSDSVIDGTESVEFQFDAPVEGLRYFVISAGNLNGNSSAGEAFIEAFDINGDSLGTLTTSGAGCMNVTKMYNNAKITRLVITANTDSQRIGSVEYELTPSLDCVAVDTEPPALFPSSGAVYLDPTTGVVNLGAWALIDDAMDNCGPVIPLGVDLPSLNCSHLGNDVPVSVTVTDLAGNVATADTSVRVFMGSTIGTTRVSSPPPFEGPFNALQFDGVRMTATCSGFFAELIVGFDSIGIECDCFFTPDLCCNDGFFGCSPEVNTDQEFRLDFEYLATDIAFTTTDCSRATIFVEAFDRFGASIGGRMLNIEKEIDSQGRVDLSAPFDDRPVAAVEVSVLAGGFAINAITHRPFEQTNVDFTSLGVSTTSALVLPDLTVTADNGSGSGLVNVLALNGLGVVGGLSDTVVDGNESLHFAFHEPVANVRYTTGVAGNLNGNGLIGEATIEAFDEQGMSLGTTNIDGTGVRDLGALFNAHAFSSFRVTAAGDSLRIGSLSFDPLVVCLDACPCDSNGGGSVDASDIALSATLVQSGDPAADVTGDGSLDFFDLTECLNALGTGCN